MTSRRLLPERSTRRGGFPTGGQRGEVGATLIELIIAAFLVGVVSIGMVEFFARGRAAFDQEESKREATLLGQQALERAVATDYAALSSWNETRTVAATDFAIAVTVQNNVPEAEMKRVQVAVTWDAVPGVSRSITLSTMVFNN